MDMTLDYLFGLVKDFSEVLVQELNENDFLPPELISFPHGACVVTSHMLAIYLDLKGVENVIVTRNKAHQSDGIHYWVVVDNWVIIDLTAHQFDEFNDECVLPIDSHFHSKFERLKEYEPLEAHLMEGIYGSEHTTFHKKLMFRLGVK